MHREVVTQFLCSEEEPVVQTKAGKLRGFQINGTYEFLGVKYADAKRFRMPQPVQPWEGVQDAVEYGYNCMDIIGDEPWGWFLYPRRRYFNSEDCQYLNIWTQHLDPEAKKPVMVWIHGGGYFGGSAIDLEAYDGESLSKESDVVCITLNHRLNILGFFDLSGYGPEYQNSGNVGIADLVAALQWIHDNIAQFGGDPENVTIFGQSGGGGKVMTLMQTPAADGLYQKAIIQSGVVGREDRIEGDDTEKLTKNILDELGITRENIHKIDEVPYRDLADAANRACEKMGIAVARPWAPVRNDYYLGNPLSVGFRKENLHIPMICGSIVFELDGKCPFGDKSRLSAQEKEQMVASRVGKYAGEIMKEFEAAYPELDVAYAGMPDTRFRVGSVDFMDLRAKSGAAPIYGYIFTYESAFKGGVLTGHGGELPFMFGNADHNIAMFRGEETERLRLAMSRSWAAFAYTGNPNCPYTPEWPEHKPETRYCMAFGNQIFLKENHDEKLMKLMLKAESER